MKEINGFSKMIIVQWMPEDSHYTKAMRVIESTHERFVKGSRFDFGFMSIAGEEGYEIIVIPMEVEA